MWRRRPTSSCCSAPLLFFLVSIEERLKRRDALQALNELRSIIHVIDMHQLTKDPSLLVTVAGKTSSSPARVLSSFEMTRYLDYCSEMVSLTSKVAVLFAQGFPDPVVTDVVSDIERIAAGLSQKIWQKITIVQYITPHTADPAGATPTVLRHELKVADGIRSERPRRACAGR